MSFRSSPKISALLQILNLIDSGNRVTASILAQELGITERTICRYLRDLQQSGYPIYFDRQRISYRFVEGYRLARMEGEVGDLHRTLDLKSRMLGATPAGLVAYDDSGRCVMCNEAICQISGGTREQLLDQNYNQLESWRQSGLLLLAQGVMNGASEAGGEFHVRSVFGGEYWVSVNMSRFEKDGRRYLMVVASAFSLAMVDSRGSRRTAVAI